MGRFGQAAVAVAVITGTTAFATGGPAGAAVTATSAATVVTVTLTGTTSTVAIGCASGTFRVDGAPASPSIACSAVTKIAINGGAADQYVDGSNLGPATFANLTAVQVNLGDGGDVYTESPVGDSVQMGPGNDTIYAWPQRSTVTDPTYQLGGEAYDTFIVNGTDQPDTITAGANATTATVTVKTDGVSRSRSAQGAKHLQVGGLGGPDTMSATGVVVGGTIDRYAAGLNGGDGNDTLTAGPQSTSLDGGNGTNTLIGGIDTDSLISRSTTDTISPGPGPDGIADAAGPHMGGRTFTNLATGGHYWGLNTPTGIIALRTRALAGNASVVTGALTRNGEQELPPGIGQLTYYLQSSPKVSDRAVLDTQPLPGQTQEVFGEGNELVDVAVPSGSWSTTGTVAGDATTTFTNGAKPIKTHGVAALFVHAPFTNANERFAHRATRDLQMRFATSPERAALAAKVANGSLTRLAAAKALMDTATYRGIDVDRAFLTFLRRTSDASGRAYWIGQLQSGTSLRKFRASLFGSAEYFTRFGGGTNAGFVKAAYTDVLGRQPDASGLAYWVGKLESGTLRGTVASTFLAAAESRQAVVTDQYLHLLGRTPSPAEAAPWITKLATSGTGEQELVAALVASSEYAAQS